MFNLGQNVAQSTTTNHEATKHQRSLAPANTMAYTPAHKRDVVPRRYLRFQSLSRAFPVPSFSYFAMVFIASTDQVFDRPEL